MTAIAAPNSFQSILAGATVVPVTVAGGTINTALTAGTVVAGILDPTTTERFFNPFAEGLAPATGQTVSEYLPSVVAVSAATANNDAAPWYTQATGLVGQVMLQLAPGSLNLVEASSVMTFRVSPSAVVIVAATGADTFN